MCSTCGCSGHDTPTQSPNEPHKHGHEHARLIELEADLLTKNNRYAAKNRKLLQRSQCLALNLVSSPGSGKTTLLTETIKRFDAPTQVAVVEGDQQTQHDAERIRETGAKAIQINTGKGCHLDAHAVGHAFEKLDLARAEFVFIENVGNLVCPAAFDLGEKAKVVVLSVTEGEDKPLKYPDMFRASALMLINKVDLLPYVEFNVERCIEFARRINPDIEVICLSATKGEHIEIWMDWLNAQRSQMVSSTDDSPTLTQPTA